MMERRTQSTYSSYDRAILFVSILATMTGIIAAAYSTLRIADLQVLDKVIDLIFSDAKFGMMLMVVLVTFGYSLVVALVLSRFRRRRKILERAVRERVAIVHELEIRKKVLSELKSQNRAKVEEEVIDRMLLEVQDRLSSKEQNFIRRS